MTEKPAPAIPQAFLERRRYRSSQLIWLVPIIAAVIGLSLAVKSYYEQGPTITITFKSGEGIEAGKTKLKFKDVQVGEVQAVSIAKNNSHVVVTAKLDKEAKKLLVADTRFWVVSPRISGSNISGLSTLMGGSYIGLDVGASKEACHEFVGLERPPAVRTDEPGRQFILRAPDLGSLSIGSPIYFRRLQVGEVIAYELNKDGRGVTFIIFIRAPYDGYVKEKTLFWQASGIELSLDADGVKVNAQSMVSVLLGGIAFLPQEDGPDIALAAANQAFTLFYSMEDALKHMDTVVETYQLLFRESVRGLSVGAPVDLRGVTIGEVSEIGLALDSARKEIMMPVEIRFYPERLQTNYRGKSGKKAALDHQKLLSALVAQGLRAQLKTGNLLTGQLYVGLDFFPNAARATIDWQANPPQLPTEAGDLGRLQSSLIQIAQKLERMPLEELAADARKTMQTLDTTLVNADRLLHGLEESMLPEARQLVSETRNTMEELRSTLTAVHQTLAADAPLQHDLREALREMGRAAQSLRSLGEYLERHPESLFQGKKEDEK